MSWSKSPKKTGNASVSNERLRDGNRLAGKGLMSSISPLLPTQAGQTQMPARAPPWSLSPITQLGMSVSFKIEREIDVDFTFIPHCLQKTVCWPVAVSIHFWLDLCPSWDWRADHESTNPFSMVPGPASIQPLLAVVLGLRKTSSDNLLITPKLALPAFALFLLYPFEGGCQQRYWPKKKCVVWSEKVTFLTEKGVVFCLSTRGLLRHDLWPRLGVQTRTSNKRLWG